MKSEGKSTFLGGFGVIRMALAAVVRNKDFAREGNHSLEGD